MQLLDLNQPAQFHNSNKFLVVENRQPTDKELAWASVAVRVDACVHAAEARVATVLKNDLGMHLEMIEWRTADGEEHHAYVVTG